MGVAGPHHLGQHSVSSHVSRQGSDDASNGLSPHPAHAPNLSARWVGAVPDGKPACKAGRGGGGDDHSAYGTAVVMGCALTRR